MAKLNHKNGIASVILRVRISDTASTVGAGLTGLTEVSAGLIISTIADNESTSTTYTAAGSTVETITTLGAFAAPTATKCRFKKIDDTNHPGIYEIHIANARWAVTNARSIIVSVLVTGGHCPPSEIQLDPVPANVTHLLDTAHLAPVVAGTPDVNMKLISNDATAADNAEAFFDGTGYAGTGNVIPTVTTLTNLPAITANWLTAAGIAADAGAEIAALVEAFIVNEGDATAVMQAIADKIAADWVAGDASPLAIAAAVRTNLTTELGRIDVGISTRASQASVDDLPTNAELATSQAAADDATLAAISAEAVKTAAILADTNELQTDLTNGGRLDLILDTVELWVKRNSVALSGLVTGAGTVTEVFVSAALGITMTVTADASGNRSNVVFS